MTEQNHGSQEVQYDVGTQRLARVYATSLLQAAAQQGIASESVLEELDSLVDDVVVKNPQLEVLFTGLGRTMRRTAIEKAFTGRATPLFLSFLMVLNEHERLQLLRPIRVAAHDLENERLRRKPVQVWSAVPLTGAEENRLADTLRQRFQFEPILKTHVDPELLGGLKIRIGDMQVDDTVRTRLDNLRTQIIARSSHEIQSRRDRFRTV